MNSKKKMGVFSVFKKTDKGGFVYKPVDEFTELKISQNSALIYNRYAENVYAIAINGFQSLIKKEELAKLCDFLNLEFIE